MPRAHGAFGQAHLAAWLGLLALAAGAEQRRLGAGSECGARCGLIAVANGQLMECGPCEGWCGDAACSPGFGEDHVTCPVDCPRGGCQSDGCRGRCGQVHDRCQRVINCGPCPSVCGDSLCDPGEAGTCPDDCGPSCRPLTRCGLRCGRVDDGCGAWLDCGACTGRCGNGLCEPADTEAGPGRTQETNANCPEDCPPPGCAPRGCAGMCGEVVDGCGRTIDCGACLGAAQCPNPNGLCEPRLAENRHNCRWECADGCGNGTCDSPDERLRCPSDCPDAQPPAGGSAGGPYRGEVGEPVRFFGVVAPSVSTAAQEWDFGDGSSAAGLSPTHTYSSAGLYEVSFKVTTKAGAAFTSTASAEILPATETDASGFITTFDMAYDAAADGIRVRASIEPKDGSPTKQGFVALYVHGPGTQAVGPLGTAAQRVAEAEWLTYSQLRRPGDGAWRGTAVFGYFDLLEDPVVPHRLGEKGGSVVVPSGPARARATESDPPTPRLAFDQTWLVTRISSAIVVATVVGRDLLEPAESGLSEPQSKAGQEFGVGGTWPRWNRDLARVRVEEVLKGDGRVASGRVVDVLLPWLITGDHGPSWLAEIGRRYLLFLRLPLPTADDSRDSPRVARRVSLGGGVLRNAGLVRVDHMYQLSDSATLLDTDRSEEPRSAVRLSTHPRIEVVSPASGATVTGHTRLVASAYDDGGVAGVQFLVDGVRVGPELVTRPFEHTWSPKDAPQGLHTLTAVARDGAGNLTSSRPVTFSTASQP